MAEEFVDLKQGRMSLNKYSLNFHQLSHYVPELVSGLGTKIRKFALGLPRDFILESKVALLNKDIDISILMLYMKQVEKEKKKQTELSERHSKNFYYSD